MIPLIYPFDHLLWFLIFCILVVIVFLPIYIFRFIISVFAKYIKFGRILDSRSTMYAVEDIDHRPTSTIVVMAFTQERVDVEKIRNSMNELLFRNNNLIEMTEYIDHWLGFCFWRKDEQFNISNHIREHHTEEGGILSYSDLQKLRTEYISQPFPKKRSPWEVIVIHDYQKTSDESGDTENETSHDVILLRFHHSLGDGPAILSLIDQTNRKPDLVELAVSPSYQQQNGDLSNFVDKLKFIFFSPFDLLMTHVFGTMDKNQFHKEEKFLTKEYFNASKSGDKVIITVNDIKSIKNHFHVGFQSVIYSAVAGSIGKTMKQSNMDVPKTMKIVTQIPIQSERTINQRLINHFGVVILNLPVGETDSLKRLKLVHKLIEEQRGSTLPFAFFVVLGLVGHLFTWMVSALTKMRLVTVAVSSNATPMQGFRFFDIPVSEIEFSVGLLSGNIGVGFHVVTYYGKLAVSASVDRSVCSDESLATKLINNFLEELNIWHKKSKELPNNF